MPDDTPRRARRSTAPSAGAALVTDAPAVAPGDLRILAAHVESPLLSADARLGTGGLTVRVGPALLSLPRPAVVAAVATAAVAAVADAPVVVAGAAAAALAYRRRLRRALPTLTLFDTVGGPVASTGGSAGSGGRRP